ncbi:ATP-binding cassette domain-containing protein [candidate division WOR-3 bacterium]|uniref:ATP-binding cassette domain-containing protein n=1 Tax=candidate division WOR-3 bacterium TaxID=2052148 RepID=A0A9D5KA36_UNCW3|nr:ATP-binding cassette domain-containing protein [candidate division WOR-3 bacterium]MBD3364944.1 ATP-binding cassette domain-containing protein [candidate division WOR-3 bacterium]
MNQKAVLKVEEVKKSFGKVQALAGISFEARRGELFGLLGPNGAGKTTTVRCICSIIKPDSGRVEVEGIDVAKKPLETLKRIGVVLEDGKLYDRLTGEENIKLFAQLHGVDNLKKRIDEVCKVLEFDEYRKRKFKDLSKGNKQKVLIGQALVIDPQLLILDEPTAGLDVPAQKVIRDLLKKIKRDRTILYSTHIMAYAEELCDRLAIIDHGQIIASGTVSQVCKKAGAADLERAFLKLVGRNV